MGIFVVPGPAYAMDPTDLRAFRGFLSYAVQSSGGDSGGPYVSGNYAVGTHAAGDTPDENGNVVQNMAIAATLSEGLAVLPGYQLELFLNKPAVTSPEPGGTFEPGQQVTGTVPAAPASAVAAGSTVRITLDGGDPFEVPVDDAGNWSFTAPESTPGAAESCSSRPRRSTVSASRAPAGSSLGVPRKSHPRHRLRKNRPRLRCRPNRQQRCLPPRLPDLSPPARPRLARPLSRRRIPRVEAPPSYLPRPGHHPPAWPIHRARTPPAPPAGSPTPAPAHSCRGQAQRSRRLPPASS
ncbi:hypothetical protein [Arthrobacter sp. SD76]|uniref:hypothetical protein n=1 Tax=Arthrobacter sp. SD76 TaxID=3415007 RepID=UPI003C72C61A